MPIEILMPALSPTMEEGKLAKWLVKEGDTVQSGDLLAEIETDKATMEFEAAEDGVIAALLVAEGTEAVRVNTPIATLQGDGDPVTPPAPETTPKTAPVAKTAVETAVRAPAPRLETASGDRIFATPLARRLAAEKGLDLATLTGSGPYGRIVKADVEGQAATATVATIPATSPAPTSPVPQTAPAPSPNGIAALYQDRAFTEIPLDGMRKTIAARLTEAKQTIPHFYLRRDAKLDSLLKTRSDINAQLEPRGIKLSVNDFIIKACALALQAVPDANAVWAGDRILRLTPSDVAVAVAIEGGLFTPVLRDADTKSLSALSLEMTDLATRARDRKLAPHEYQGGSFAISNLGMFGIENFDAVINPPHGAILAVGAGVPKPIVLEDGSLGRATVMSLTLSVDHRVIDGALGAKLLAQIVENLENPLGMLV